MGFGAGYVGLFWGMSLTEEQETRVRRILKTKGRENKSVWIKQPFT